MRKRINKRVNVQDVINEIEHRVGVYTTYIKWIMSEKNVDYKEAKFIMNLKLNKYENIL
jgi:hypothetical protein